MTNPSGVEASRFAGQLLARLLVVALMLFVAFGPAAAQPTLEELDALFDGSVKLSGLERQVDELTKAGDFVKAMSAARAAHAEALRLFGASDARVGDAVHRLAVLHKALRQRRQAAEMFARALAIRERAPDPNGIAIAATLYEMAEMKREDGQFDESAILHQRALAIRDAELTAGHPAIARSLRRLIEVLWALKRYEDARPFYRRALALRGEREGAIGDVTGTVIGTTNTLALRAVADRGHLPEAEKMLRDNLAMVGRSAPNNPGLGLTHNSLGLVLERQGRLDEALESFQLALAIREKALGPSHAEVGETLDNLAAVHYAQRRWSRALELWQRSADIVAVRRDGGTGIPSPAPVQPSAGPDLKGWTQPQSRRFIGLVKAANRVAAERKVDAAPLAQDAFLSAQRAMASQAAASLALMAARAAAGDSGLEALVRDRQDLIAEWQERSASDNSEQTSTADPQRAADRAARLDWLTAVGTQIAEIDNRLRERFPSYADLATPVPATIAEVRNALRFDEALVLLLETPEWQPTQEETFIWVVTKDGPPRWIRSDLGASAIAEAVAALRCGLDQAGNWTWIKAQSRWVAKTDTCKALKPDGLEENEHPPFDLIKAHDLYDALFGKAEELIADKHLLIVSSGALTQLPLQVLVTEAPKQRFAKTAADLAAVKWLGVRQPITVLPSVSALKSLRRDAKPSKAAKPYIGFGNPLLDGRLSDGEDQKLRPLAAAWQTCETTDLNGACRAAFPRLSSGRPLEASKIREWSPRPQQACELCAIGHTLPEVKLDLDVVLGASATEREVKRLGAVPVGGERSPLQDYKVVHFATHGVVADVKRGFSEPGLILTPPPDGQESEEDDGYLAASEIVGLKLDADWVILSACNTAAGTADNSEALSGLARAFFYAGARALLVSNWEVYTNAAVDLTTRMMKAIAGDAKLGRAAAMRGAIEGMLQDAARDKDALNLLHPSYWGAFSLVGEGGN